MLDCSPWFLSCSPRHSCAQKKRQECASRYSAQRTSATTRVAGSGRPLGTPTDVTPCYDRKEWSKTCSSWCRTNMDYCYSLGDILNDTHTPNSSHPMTLPTHPALWPHPLTPPYGPTTHPLCGLSVSQSSVYVHALSKGLHTALHYCIYSGNTLRGLKLF